MRFKLVFSVRRTASSTACSEYESSGSCSDAVVIITAIMLLSGARNASISEAQPRCMRDVCGSWRNLTDDSICVHHTLFVQTVQEP